MSTFNGDTKIITLDAPTAGVLEVDVNNDLYSEWKVWVTQSDNAKYLPAFRTAAGDPLTPGLSASPYYFIRNDLGWRIISEDFSQTINYVGNLIAEDSTLPIINVTPGRSVLHLGLQPVVQNVDQIFEISLNSSFGGEVYINTDIGVAGTTYPLGTPNNPVSNFDDAWAIAERINVKSLFVVGEILVTKTMRFWSVRGHYGATKIDVNNFDVSGTKFENVSLEGTLPVLTHGVVLERGLVNGAGLFNFRGEIIECSLEANLSLQAGLTLLKNCSSHVPGTGRPVLDAANNLVNISVRGWHGGLEVRNISVALSTASFDFDAGSLRLVATCTDGEIVVRGLVDFEDLSAGSTIVVLGLSNTREQHLANMLLASRAVVSPDDLTVTVYDSDLATILKTFTISADTRTRTPV